MKISLADVAFTMVANLGFLAQAQVHAREPAAARQRHVRRVRPRLRDQRRPARDGRRHQPQPVAARWCRRPASTSTCPRWSAPSTPTSRKEDDRYRARDAHRRAARSRGSRRARSTRSARRSTRTACAGVRTRRSRSCSTTTGASSAKNPVFGDVDHPGIGTLRTPASPLQLPDRSAGRARAARRCSARTPTRCSPTCSASRPPRSAACTTTASSPAAVPRSDERASEPNPPSPTPGSSSRRRTDPSRSSTRGAARGVPRRRSRACSTTALLPRSWHWALLPPRGADRGARASTATRVAAPRWTTFPQRMWVGGRVHVARPLRIGVDAERVSRHRDGRREGGRRRPLLARHRRAHDRAGGRATHRGGTGPRVPQPSARSRPSGADADDAARRRVGRGTRRRPGAAVPLLRGHRQRAPHPLRPPVRDRGRGLPRPRRARTAHRDPARRARTHPSRPGRARGLVPRPRPALRQPSLLARRLTHRRRRDPRARCAPTARPR